MYTYNCVFIVKTCKGGEAAQEIIYDTCFLEEEPDSVPITHIIGLTANGNSRSRGSGALF